MALPTVAIVGRPNVGKSTLFNRIAGERISIVEDVEGVTRDRIYATAEWLNHQFSIIDTGGIDDVDAPFMEQIKHQAEIAMDEADVIVFVVSGKEGITDADEYVARMLYKTHKPVILAVNKVDNPEMRTDIYDFYALGLGEPLPVSSVHGIGTGDVLDAIVENLPTDREAENPDVIKFSLIGRPNVGKSSLLNNLLREEKAIVTDIEGTTRDVIEEYVNIKGVPLKLIDTAGIRDTDDVVEKIGVERSKKALEEADLVLLVLNSSEPLTEQDRTLLEISQNSNRIILLNKTDLPQAIQMEELPEDVIPISVLKNENIDKIEDRINQLFFDNAGLVEKDATYLSNARHISLIEKALESLEAVNQGLELGMPVDLLQVDMTRTWEVLGEITGDAAPDELITQLFSQFCLGK